MTRWRVTSAYARSMAEKEPLPERQGRMGYQTAKLNKATGFAVAHLETLPGTGEERIVGVFKGEHAFFRKYANSTRKMIYEGFVEHDGVIYYAVVTVVVEVRTRQAGCVSSGSPSVWQRITDA